MSFETSPVVTTSMQGAQTSKWKLEFLDATPGLELGCIKDDLPQGGVLHSEAVCKRTCKKNKGYCIIIFVFFFFLSKDMALEISFTHSKGGSPVEVQDPHLPPRSRIPVLSKGLPRYPRASLDGGNPSVIFIPDFCGRLTKSSSLSLFHIARYHYHSFGIRSPPSLSSPSPVPSQPCVMTGSEQKVSHVTFQGKGDVPFLFSSVWVTT